MLAAAVAGAVPASAAAQYDAAVRATPGLAGYWRLGELGGTAAADASGRAEPGSYLGAPGLGAGGALSGDSDPAARFDGVDDELQAGGAPVAATLEGWFFWEAGVALMRDATASAGWILAFDSGGRVAYRAGGTTFTTALATADLRDGWHHVVLAAAGGAANFYVDGALVHSGSGAGGAPAAMPWHVMRNGTTAQFTRGRADEVAVYDIGLGRGRGARALRSRPRRGRHDGAGDPHRPGRDRPARPRRARLGRRARRRPRRLRRVSGDERGGPVHARQPVAPERVRVHRRVRRRRDAVLLRGHRKRPRQQPQSTVGAGPGDAPVTRRPPAPLLAGAAVRDPGDLLRGLGGGDDRQLRARRAPELPRRQRRHAAGRRQPRGPAGEPLAGLPRRSGLRRRTRGGHDGLPRRGERVLPAGRAADARRGLPRSRLRARGDHGRQDLAAVLAVLVLQPAERARLRRPRGRLGVHPGRARRRRRPRCRHLRPARRAASAVPGASSPRRTRAPRWSTSPSRRTRPTSRRA